MADFHIDEDVNVAIVPLLLAMGHAVVTARDLGMLGAKDENHLLTAAQSNRIIVTHNWKDYFLLHRAWLLWTLTWHVGMVHSGILVVRRQPPQEIAQKINDLITLIQGTGQSLTNRLHRWEPITGWVEY